LAWAMLASGAPAGSLRGSGSADMADAMQRVATRASAAHCDGMSMQQADSQRAPATPAGHGCCQAGCHCLSTCSVALTVPPLRTTVSLPRATLPVLALEAPAWAPAMPPLRPPIA
ncbi:MAG TPA: hypothetical protein VFW60_01270, partial [Rhodanobacteraceae bacterium]|nr:hypothetical protein [Rhodanobacteraceae bacterium]